MRRWSWYRASWRLATYYRYAARMRHCTALTTYDLPRVGAFWRVDVPKAPSVPKRHRVAALAPHEPYGFKKRHCPTRYVMGRRGNGHGPTGTFAWRAFT